MAIQDKIVISANTVEEFLDENFYSTDFVSTMSEEEQYRLATEAIKLVGIDDQKADELTDMIPMDPGHALRSLVHPLLGKQFLAGGFNFADVEKAFGPNWLERFEVKND